MPERFVAAAATRGRDAATRAVSKRDVGRLDAFSLEDLHRALVLLGRGARGEGSEVAPPPRLRILLARIEPIPPRLQLSNHWFSPLERACVPNQATVGREREEQHCNPVGEQLEDERRQRGDELAGGEDQELDPDSDQQHVPVARAGIGSRREQPIGCNAVADDRASQQTMKPQPFEAVGSLHGRSVYKYFFSISAKS